MSNQMIPLHMDYTGFAEGNMETLELLNKALTAGSGVDASGFTGGRALIPESLDTTLVNILWTQDEARLFQRLKKQPISSPVHQWDDRTDVGARDGAWVAEGGASIEADQTITRRYQTAKYLQTLREVTLQASISKMIENAMTIEQNAGALWIVREVEKALFYANSSYVEEQPDGLIAQIPSSNVLDARGYSADSATFEKLITSGMRVIRESYGKGSLMLASTKVMEDIQRLLNDRLRFEARERGLGATVFDRYPTTFGTLELLDDIFIEEGGEPAASSLTSQRPGTVTIDTGPTVAADAASEFTADDAGDYYYKFVGMNKYGDATVTAESTVAAVTAGDKVTFTIGPGSPVPTAIKVYRTKKDGASGSTVLHAFTVPYTGDPTTVVDYNSYLPGTSNVFLLTMEAIYDAIEWFQFLPMMKFDLYPTNKAAYPFLMLLFGAMALKKSVQHINIKNVAPSSLNWY